MNGHARGKDSVMEARVRQVLQLRTESAAMFEALEAINDFYGQAYSGSTADARRTLRDDLEYQNIALVKKFLADFDQVKDRLNNASAQLAKLEKECNTLAANLSSADTDMKQFMQTAADLENQRTNCLNQAKDIQNFLQKYQLTDAEVDALAHAPISARDDARHNGSAAASHRTDQQQQQQQTTGFFSALTRLNQAHSECNSMVQQHHFSAGFELLEALSEHQNKAYLRLFEWIRAKCDDVSRAESSDDIDAVLQVALKFLRQRPAYYVQCQELVVTARKALLVRRFFDALTAGGPGMQYRPIDMQAHDPVRYVGDMLAWMHQAIASEDELFSAIFDMSIAHRPYRHHDDDDDEVDGGKEEAKPSASDSPAEEPPQPAQQQEQEDSPAATSIAALLAMALEGLGKHLSARILQTLEERNSVGVLYSLVDLLAFYDNTLTRIVPVENSVSSAIKACLEEASRKLLSTLQSQAEEFKVAPGTYPVTLNTMVQVLDGSRQLKDVLQVYAASLSSVPSDPQSPCSITAIVGAIIEPLIELCRTMTQPLEGNDAAVLMVNNIGTLRTVLAMQGSGGPADQWLAMLEDEYKSWFDAVVKQETDAVLKNSGAADLLQQLEAPTAPALSTHQVQQVLSKFYGSLTSAATVNFDKLEDHDTREEARRRFCEALASCYDRMHSAVSDPSRRITDQSILKHTPREVRLLLGI